MTLVLERNTSSMSSAKTAGSRKAALSGLGTKKTDSYFEPIAVISTLLSYFPVCVFAGGVIFNLSVVSEFSP